MFTGIRQLQCILLKVALLVGVEIHVNVSFVDIMEPTAAGKYCMKCQEHFQTRNFTSQ